jgi:hypothetical protein
MNTTLIQLLRIARISAPLDGVDLYFDPGLDLSLLGGISQFIEYCYEGDIEISGPYEGIATEAVEARLSHGALRSQNITIRDTLDSYISMELRTSRYRGFLSEDHITVILDQAYYSYDGKPKPKAVADVENCCLIFDKLWEMADLKNGSTVFFLLDEPLEITEFTFRKELVNSLRLKNAEFIEYFKDAGGEKRACFKGQLKKFLQHTLPADRLSLLFSRFDEIFQNTTLAYDRLCIMNSEYKLSVQLSKEALNFLERSRGIFESLKSEILVLATNAVGFGYLDYSNLFSLKNILIAVVLVLINITFTIVLNNGINSLAQLRAHTQEQMIILKHSTPNAEHKRIEEKEGEFMKRLEISTRQFKVCIAILWLPLAGMAVLAPFIGNGDVQSAIASLMVIIF